MENEERVAPEGWVILISGDGHEFYVEEEYAVVSKVINMMLNSTQHLSIPVAFPAPFHFFM